MQLDAYEIATTFGLPTLNGYSGQNPSGWTGIWEIKGGYYLQSIHNWINQNKLTNVYAYNANSKSWEEHAYAGERLMISSPIFFFGAQNNSRTYITAGLSGTEEKFTWTEGRHLDFFAALEDYEPTKPIHAVIDCNVFNGMQRVNVIVNEAQHIKLVAQDGLPVEFDFAPLADGKVHIAMEFPDAVSPKQLGMSQDARKLALAMKTWTFMQQ